MPRPGSTRRRGGASPAADALRETRAGGWFRAAPGHPWLDPAVTGDPGHVPARVAVAVDGKERKLAKAGGKKKVHLLGAVTHVTGLVIGQDKVAKSGKANEVTHFKPLLEPLPLRGAVVTADAMQATRDNARYAREVKHAHFLWPVLGNQPGMYAALDALDWENTSVAAATSEITRGRVETRTIRVLPVPDGLDFPYAEQAILIERYVTVRKNGPLGDAQLRGCPVRHQPGRRSQHAAGPARPRPRALDRGAPALATRRDMGRGQIAHPHRKQAPGDVRHRQPRHHPLPHTRSNQVRRGNPPQRTRPPSGASDARPPGPVTRLNTLKDFHESLLTHRDRLFSCLS